MERLTTLLLVAAALTLGCGGLDPEEAGSRDASMSVEEASLRHKCPVGTFRCGKICCDASGDVSCVNGVCCVPPHCP